MNRHIPALWLIPVIIICILLGFFSTEYQYFDFDYEISIIELISLLTTIFLGIYFANLVESSRVEKAMVIEVVKLSIDKTKVIIEKVDANNINFLDINRDLKDLSVLLGDLEDFQQICEKRNDSLIIKPAFLKVKSHITSTAPVSNIINLSPTAKVLAKKQIKNLRSILLTILVKTNRR